jgi:hypothetical protein
VALWIVAALVLVAWLMRGGRGGGGVRPWPTDGTPDAGGLTDTQKAALIAAQNAAAAALTNARAEGVLLSRWVEIRLHTATTYIAILEGSMSDYVERTAAGVRQEVCGYTSLAAELAHDPTLKFCP